MTALQRRTARYPTFFGRLGLGIDLRKQAPGSLRAIHRWLALHKRFRSLLYSGTTVRSDESDRGFVAHGVVADHRDEAVFALVWLERALASRRVRIDGLDPGHLVSDRGRWRPSG